MAKAAPRRKAANGYKLAESLPKGEILEDISKKRWKLGSPIGQGGFGEIYTAQDASSTGSSYPFVIKIEPHANGPLFVEMHFYMRNAKPSDVEEFKKEKGLKTFGMPLYLGSGSHEHKSEKYRFIVMEKFGSDLWKLFLENGRTLPYDTVFKLGIQMLDVLEYIHNRGYVHADIKGANILMGITKGTTHQAFLVDFGLATKFTTEKQFKPNPKKAHDGTIEYLSRDAHKGVQTRRGDLEILAYNLIQWLGCTLPWEINLKDPNLVHKSKEEHMDNVPKMIKACFGHRTPPGAIVDYLNYLKTLEFNSEPNYKKIRKIFISGIKDAGGSEKTPLSISSSKRTPQKRKNDRKPSPSPKRKVAKGKKRTEKPKTETEHLEDDEDDKDDEVTSSKNSEVKEARDDVIDESYVEEPKPKRRGLKEPIKKKDSSKKAEENDSGMTAGNKKTSKKNKLVKKGTDEGQEADQDEEVSSTKNSELGEDCDDVIDESYVEEPKLKKRGLKEKSNEPPVKKTAGSKKIEKDDSSVDVGNKESSDNKVAKKDTDEGQSETADPYEGYTDAMKEVMVKKLQNGKPKGRRVKQPVVEEDMEGYTESMKELASKKRDRLVTKRKKDAKVAPSTEQSESSGMTRGNRLRAKKEVCYGEFDSD